MINANIRTKNFLIDLVYFIPVTELVICNIYKRPLSASVLNRLTNLSHMGHYGSDMQVFLATPQNQRIGNRMNHCIVDIRTIKFLFQDRREIDLDTRGRDCDWLNASK